MEKIILDVREKDEFLAEHIKDSINIALSDFASHAPGVLLQIKDKPILLMCRSGTRAHIALTYFSKFGIRLTHTPEVFKGGLTAWKAAGNPVVQVKTSHLPIMRQVQIAAGSLVFISSFLGLTVKSTWSLLALFVGGGLIFAGITGFCGMALLLAKMPWNRTEDCLSGCTIQQQSNQ